MGVYIIGMDMPTSCGACAASGTSVCKVWMRSDNLKVRHSDCPLIEVQTPRADLIERDAWYQETLQYGEKTREMVRKIFEAAPTVIPKEDT